MNNSIFNKSMKVAEKLVGTPKDAFLRRNEINKPQATLDPRVILQFSEFKVKDEAILDAILNDTAKVDESGKIIDVASGEVIKELEIRKTAKELHFASPLAKSKTTLELKKDAEKLKTERKTAPPVRLNPFFEMLKKQSDMMSNK